MAYASTFSNSMRPKSVDIEHASNEWRNNLKRNRELGSYAVDVLAHALHDAAYQIQRCDATQDITFSCRLRFKNPDGQIFDQLVCNKRTSDHGFRRPVGYERELTAHLIKDTIAEAARCDELICKLCLLYADVIANPPVEPDTFRAQSSKFVPEVWSNKLKDEFEKQSLLQGMKHPWI